MVDNRNWVTRMKCFVGGIGGSGKTSLITATARLVDGCEVIHGSKLLFEALGLSQGDYMALRGIAAEVKEQVFGRELQNRLARQLAPGNHLLIDAHYLNFWGQESRRVVGPWIAAMDILVVLEVDAGVIARRLEGDCGRSDRLVQDEGVGVSNQVSLEVIQKRLTETRVEAGRLALKYGKPLIAIDNSYALSSAVEVLSSELRGVVKGGRVSNASGKLGSGP